ncbi:MULTISPECIES: TetR/AcrR family transcriptional regulator [Acinetobacter]|uniref:HTH tetR-type domain-containing protein n=2 Tax=Acinetobacter TaxID=469 RepID=A0A1Z9YW55_9GAMM|nr:MULTISPECIES: TetR/AcrR family transcriptional regulator [Acinetobacter]OUY06403.1 hypothetical protein CAP51_13365 [Acinetobacter populi]SNX46856.1 transcriptional regulator, TetR family [Acinetobacter puyangensis]
MARQKSDVKRDLFLKVAKEVFQELSFGGASMDEIAAKAGSSKATLYRYFESKDALYSELISKIAAERENQVMTFLYKSIGVSVTNDLPKEVIDATFILDPDQDVEITLRKFGKYVLKFFHTPNRFAATRMVIAASANPEIGKMFYEQGPVKALKLVEQYYASAIEAGHFRRANPSIMALHFRGLLESEVLELGLLNIKPDLNDEEIEGIVDRAVDVFLRAYKAQ